MRIKGLITIRSKVIAGFCAMAIFLAVGGGSILWLLQQAKIHLQQNTQSVEETIKGVEGLEELLLQMEFIALSVPDQREAGWQMKPLYQQTQKYRLAFLHHTDLFRTSLQDSVLQAFERAKWHYLSVQDPESTPQGESFTRAEDYRQSYSYLSALLKTLSYEQVKSVSRAGELTARAQWSVLAGCVFILLTALSVAWFGMTHISKPISNIYDAVHAMGSGVLPTLLNVKREDEIGKMSKAMNTVIRRLEDASAFALAIGEERFDTAFQPLSADDTLGNSLVAMRNSLMKSAIEDEQRNWSNDGYNRFVGILRKYKESLDELGPKVIAELVEYIGCNQGNLYALKQEEGQEAVMEMIGSFAWNRRKYFEQQIAFGEGLVGQVWREGDTILLTEIPDHYVSIHSGLGEANPNTILVVPLTFNETIYGVIELAGFEAFKKHEIAFVERLAESIAASISEINNNKKQQILLETTQKQSDKFREKDTMMREQIVQIKQYSEELLKEKRQLVEEKELLLKRLAILEKRGAQLQSAEK